MSKLPDPAQDGASASNPLERTMKVVVAVLGVMIVAGLAAVIFKMASLATGGPSGETADGPAPAAAATSLPVATSARPVLELPSGASVRTMSLSGDRLAIHYSAPLGDGIAVVEVSSGRIVQRIRLAPEDSSPP